VTLREVLKQEDTVLFIGSGISTWSGLPSWSGLLEELADFIEGQGGDASLVRAETRRGDLLLAASYGVDKLSKEQFGRFIRQACRYGIARPHEIHRKIVSLGPRCFVETNYDDLIQQSLRVWRPELSIRPPITNRHLTETAEIIHARALDFVFKPHGDVADCDSIILASEHYLQLMPQGERHAALEALKVILASRPVVYLGFGLRDPDFGYVRGLLANTYKGAVRDHYAIMPDVSPGEIDYWRRSYGIHLIGYPTRECPDGRRDHSALLGLLDDLRSLQTPTVVESTFDPGSADTLLALARYAAGLARVVKVSGEIPIRVRAVNGMQDEVVGSRVDDPFHGALVQDLLGGEGPRRALLLGLPGAGKTHAIKRAVGQLAEALHQRVLSDSSASEKILVPVMLDLKLYGGDLQDLAGRALPIKLPIDELLRHFQVKFFLDAFNEMPREYVESGHYEKDIARFVTSVGDASIIIGSRTDDGLNALALPHYLLNLINEDTVVTELRARTIELPKRFSRELGELLRRPFWFSKVAEGAVRLPAEGHLREFYRDMLAGMRRQFASRFGVDLVLESVLAHVAYDALNSGEVTFPLESFLHAVNTRLTGDAITGIDAHDIANWLVSTGMLTPYRGGRVALAHQSITEYLAATELARRYCEQPRILTEKLHLRRWDQTLFLTLSLLPQSHADSFLTELLTADLRLALIGVKYLETGTEAIVSRLLSFIEPAGLRTWWDGYQIAKAIKLDLPLTKAHVSELQRLAKIGYYVGAAAAARLIALQGASVKYDMLDLFLKRPYDSELCRTGIASGLKQFATPEDAQLVARCADIWEGAPPEVVDPKQAFGLVGGAGELLKGVPLSAIRRAFLPPPGESMKAGGLRMRILCSILQAHRGSASAGDALELAGELLLNGVREASVAIYNLSPDPSADPPHFWKSFTPAHALCLERQMQDEGSEPGPAIEALTELCAARADLREFVLGRAAHSSVVLRAALLHCARPDDLAPLFHAFEALLGMKKTQRLRQPVRLLRCMDLDWTGRERQYIQLLRLRDPEVASAIVLDCPGRCFELDGEPDIPSVKWWLDWMSRLESTEEGRSLASGLGELLGWYGNADLQRRFVAEFNRPTSRYRRVLLDYVLPFFNSLTTDELSEDAVAFLLTDLRQGKQRPYSVGHFLGYKATDSFVSTRLIPMFTDAQEPLLNTLEEVLECAGGRHGRRYTLEFRSRSSLADSRRVLPVGVLDREEPI
jgi:SIR2-like domain